MKLEALRRYMPLALSWREKLQADPEAAADAAAEQKRVETTLRRLREDAVETQRARAQALREALALQEALPRLLERGQIAPQQANDQNRKLRDVIADLQTELAGYRTLLQAHTAADAGGFVDLPLEEYPKALRDAHVVPAASLFWRRLEAEDRRTILVTLAVAIVGVGALFYFMRWRDRVAFTLEMAEGPQGPILSLHCHSDEALPLYLLMPWHDAGDIAAADDAYKAYQVSLQFRFDPREPFRTLPPSDQPWRHAERDLQRAGPVRVLPQLSEVVTLDLGAVRELYPDAIGLRLQVRNPRGNVAFTETVMWR